MSDRTPLQFDLVAEFARIPRITHEPRLLSEVLRLPLQILGLALRPKEWSQ